MRRRRAHTESENSGMLVNAGDGSFVAGERLKQVDVPVETLLGAANGAVSGAVVSGAISAAVTVAKDGSKNILQNAFRNITGTHLIAVLAGTAAMAALGALVRYSRASKHNEWSERHYAFMEEKSRGPVSHSDRVDARRDAEDEKGAER
jgi:hypothetical protein